MGASLSLAADLLHYSFHLCLFFLLIFKKENLPCFHCYHSCWYCSGLCLRSSVISGPLHPSAPYLAVGTTCRTPSIPGIPKSYSEHRAKSEHWVKSAREGAYQKECSHCGDLVQFHQQSECLLMVATVLLIDKEFVFLQGKTKWLIDSDTTGESATKFFINRGGLQVALALEFSGSVWHS